MPHDRRMPRISGLGLTIAAASTLAVSGLALACAVDWPARLLPNRQRTVSAPYSPPFQEAILAFGERRDPRLTAVEESRYWVYNRSDTQDANTEQARRQGLSPEQIAVLDQLRGLEDGQAVLHRGQSLPDTVRLYEAAAADWRGGRLAQAAQGFQDVLALPPRQQPSRAVWAAFMLGKLAVRQGDIAAADQHFQHTRTLAAQGEPDPAGLAVASFGEQARPHYQQAKQRAAQQKPDQDYLNTMVRATRLYAAMAAQDSTIGQTSLMAVARHILANPAELEAALNNPDLQTLLLAYCHALPRQDYLLTSVIDPDDPQATETVPSRLASTQDVLALLQERLDQGQDIAHPDIAAHLAYQAELYDLAARLADKSDSALALWVQAKLAYRNGQQDRSLSLMSLALRSSPKTDDLTRRLSGETATLLVARGDFIDALTLFCDQGDIYWQDGAYLAESVLTIAEVKRFVDQAPGQAPRIAPTILSQLRDVLARRLVRAGRYDEAAPYFSKDETRNDLRFYAQQIASAPGLKDDIDKAEAWYRAAVSARENGMEIMGSELAPDWSYMGGSFEHNATLPEPSPMVSVDEVKRLTDHAVTPNLRFHYRYVALDHALTAADLLPPRSQAFAAVLCQSAHWMLQSQDDGAAAALYRRYVDQGALVPFASHFGWTCPDPDFAGAKQTRRHLKWKKVAAAFGPAWRFIGNPAFDVGALFLLGSLLTFSLVRRAKKTRR